MVYVLRMSNSSGLSETTMEYPKQRWAIQTNDGLSKTTKDNKFHDCLVRSLKVFFLGERLMIFILEDCEGICAAMPNWPTAWRRSGQKTNELCSLLPNTPPFPVHTEHSSSKMRLFIADDSTLGQTTSRRRSF